MLPNPTLDKLQTLRLHGMIKALSEQHATPDINDLSFDERLGLMVDRELTDREDARLSTRLKAARLRHNACLEDIDYRSPRGLGKALILDKSEPEWTEFYSPGGAPFDSTARAVWLERMRGYATKGYAFDLEENEDQIRCVAAPVRGVDGKVVAAVSVSSAAQYMSDARMAELTKTVTDAANAISRDLGWSPKT